MDSARAASEPGDSAESPRPTSTSGPDDAESGGLAILPPWVTVFILIGALGCLVLIFSVVSLLVPRITSRPPPSGRRSSSIADPEAARERDEIIARKMRQLDESTPARSYKEWKSEARDETKAARQYGTFIVCVICLESLQDKDMIRNLPCGHIYHSDCIAKWFLKQHDTCPLCKTYYVPHDESDSRSGSRRGLYEQAALFRIYQTPRAFIALPVD
ncbi:hypothetical protein SODALDRAFT_325731 [Sodiomyces alkalinus F11]|uniref:RING-type domain-containing protein n=1 Tax=Sodiomyces alkalinus (strain CBS 110278 / VKM F-3762 / F11) TaxID=1314773 RepID=A0A3N2PPU6_SODAK|nr:hypothetical protein SODALDRAFT_325731 [Sodiomyces alkalinus F11]ROT36386.1 hypothetical protein SODALDRAFT_325731 [Sodiomyces alkalinus F11]